MRALKTPLILLCALALVLAAAGCGGDDDGDSGPPSEAESEQPIKELGVKFEDAIEQDDVAAFCDLLAPSTIEMVGGEEACLKKYAKNPVFDFDDTDMTVKSVEFDEGGESATALLANKGFTYYQYEDGAWHPALAL